MITSYLNNKVERNSLSIAKETAVMKIKGKKMKIAVQNAEMEKMNGHIYFSCLHNGTRRPCSYHCKKCFFESIYCHNN